MGEMITNLSKIYTFVSFWPIKAAVRYKCYSCDTNVVFLLLCNICCK